MSKKNRNRDQALSCLVDISKLEYDWNLYGANPISKSVIDLAREIISGIDLVPDYVFPVATNSIQIEYGDRVKEYLEFDIFKDHISYLYVDYTLMSNRSRSQYERAAISGEICNKSVCSYIDMMNDITKKYMKYSPDIKDNDIRSISITDSELSVLKGFKGIVTHISRDDKNIIDSSLDVYLWDGEPERDNGFYREKGIAESVLLGKLTASMFPSIGYDKCYDIRGLFTDN